MYNRDNTREKTMNLENATFARYNGFAVLINRVDDGFAFVRFVGLKGKEQFGTGERCFHLAHLEEF